MAVSMMLLASCSADEGTVDNPSGSQNPEGSGFMAFNIANTEAFPNAAVTQDGETFDDGTADENAFDPESTAHNVLFFTADGTFAAAYPLSLADSQNNIFLAHGNSYEENHAQAVIILNWDKTSLDNLTASKPSLAKVTQEVAKASSLNAGGYHTMTSSVYSANGKPVASTSPAGGYKFYTTQSEAIDNAVKMWVERTHAKVTLAFGAQKDYNFDTEAPLMITGKNELFVRKNYITDGVTPGMVQSAWKINVISWGVNATEQEEYLFKNIGDGTGTGWNGVYAAWNYPQSYRSFWAVDPNYDGGDYPDQYREAKDKPSVVGAETMESSSLTYSSFNDFVAARAGKQFAPENTFDSTPLSTADVATQAYLRRGSHVIVAAQLLVAEIDPISVYTGSHTTWGVIDGVEDKYYAQGVYWTLEPLMMQYLDGFKNGVRNFQEKDPTDGIFISKYDSNGNIYISNASDAKPVDYETVADVFTLKPARIDGGDGEEILALKDGITLYTDDKKGEKVELTEDIEKIITLYVTPVKKYTNGLMYYAIPVRHNKSALSSSLTGIYTTLYGMVRNHWYQVTVNDILNVGVPVDDPDQPIVPYSIPDYEGAIAVQIEVLPWKQLNFDNVVM